MAASSLRYLERSRSSTTRIGRPSGATRVLTSHDPRAALAEADMVLALKDGRIAYAGEPAGFSDARLQELYA